LKCIVCHTPLGAEPQAALAPLVSGDESVRSWFCCDRCHLYTGEELIDRFLGDTWVRAFGPIPADVGGRIVSLVAQCPSPADTFCSCASHAALLAL
jgi:hypothetical protein